MSKARVDVERFDLQNLDDIEVKEKQQDLSQR
jgi:hypothetical protein